MPFPPSIHYSKQLAAGSDGIKQWGYFSISTTSGRDGKGFPDVIWHCSWNAVGGHSWLSDDCGSGHVWTVAASTAQWSMKLHALGIPLPSWAKGLPSTKNNQKGKKNEQTNYDSERCDYFQPWNDYKKTDLNEWIILMIKEKQIELFSIGLLSSFYLDASLL